MAPIIDWLLERALGAFELPALVDELCPRLVAAGLPLVRVNVSFSILHPLIRAQSLTWWRQHGRLDHDRMRHGLDTEGWQRSPYSHMIESSIGLLHLSTADAAAAARHPLIADLRDQGVTDYLARAVPFDEARRSGLMMSFATDRAGGFRTRTWPAWSAWPCRSRSWARCTSRSR